MLPSRVLSMRRSSVYCAAAATASLNRLLNAEVEDKKAATAYTSAVASEIQKLLPTVRPILNINTRVSAAELIAATAASQISGTHSPRCPVHANEIPLTSISTSPQFTSNSCALCAKKRLAFLVSEHFCNEFQEKCIGSSASSNSTIPPHLEKAINASFGSVAALKDDMIMHAAHRRQPGWTWLVYNASRSASNGKKGVLQVISMPSNDTPLGLGLWPLANMNMSEMAIAKLCDMGENRTVGGYDSEEPLSWQRAARNPAAAVTQEVRSAAPPPLENLKQMLAGRSWEFLDWSFINEQFLSAERYYTSSERLESQEKHRKHLVSEATLEAMEKLRDSGAIIYSSDTVEVTAASTSTPASATPTETSTATATGGDASADQRTSGSSSSSSEAASASPTVEEMEEGGWRYRYANGEVTEVKADGTKVFITAQHKATVRTDGSTLFEYPNGTSILDRADGVRVTRFTDGSVVEEKIQ